MQPSSQPPPAPEELAALLRLLDDDTPEVRRVVAGRLGSSGGDLSEWLSGLPRELGRHEQRILTEMLRPPRRETLEREWLVPSGGAAAMSEDWEGFEAMLRLISDFLHDGISIRQPLSDALDLLAEEAVEHEVSSSEDLRVFLFVQDRMTGNEDDVDDPANLDLAWAIQAGRSNPLGLSLVFMLVARRLDLDVEGVDFPEHFLCRIHRDGYPVIVDCFDQGRQHLQSTLLENPDMGREERAVLRRTADPGTILLRVLEDLGDLLDEADREEDADLVRRLRETLL